MSDLLRHCRDVSLITLLALLSGCALSPFSPPQERPCGRWDNHASKLKALQRWTVAGKVNLRTSQQNDTANFDWQQKTPAAYRMMISGPFGIGRNTLDQIDHNVTLANSNGTFHAGSPEGLMQEQLGWSLPISSLYYWARALPAPEQPHRLEHDECGYPLSLDQQGWHIEYSQWTFSDGYWLPGRLKMRYGQLNVILLLKEWHSDTANT